MANNVKDLKQLRKKAERDGWTVELTNGGHYKWMHPNGCIFFSAQTPGDFRVITKIRQRLKYGEIGRAIRR